MTCICDLTLGPTIRRLSHVVCYSHVSFIISPPHVGWDSCILVSWVIMVIGMFWRSLWSHFQPHVWANDIITAMLCYVFETLVLLVSVFPAFLQWSNTLLQSGLRVSRSNFVISVSLQAKFGHWALGLGFAQMSVHVTIQLSLSSFIGFSLSCQCLLSHFTPCSCFSCA